MKSCLKNISTMTNRLYPARKRIATTLDLWIKNKDFATIQSFFAKNVEKISKLMGTAGKRQRRRPFYLFFLTKIYLIWCIFQNFFPFFTKKCLPKIVLSVIYPSKKTEAACIWPALNAITTFVGIAWDLCSMANIRFSIVFYRPYFMFLFGWFQFT